MVFGFKNETKILTKQSVYKYCNNSEQTPILCCQAYTMFEKSYKKLRQIYLTNNSIYVISHKKVKHKIEIDKIIKIYVGILAGQFFIVSKSVNLIIDYTEQRKKFIQIILSKSPLCQFEYINYTLLDFLFQKHKKFDNQQKMTQYDSNERKIQLKYHTGQKMNLRELKQKWQIKTINTNDQKHSKQKAYVLKKQIISRKYWRMYQGCKRDKQQNARYTIKVYSKKCIGVQSELLSEIWSQRNILQQLSSPYTPCLIKSFYSPSNIYLVFQHFNGSLLNKIQYLSSIKMVNLISQLVVAMGLIHQAGFVWNGLNMENVMLTNDGFVMLYSLGTAQPKGQSIHDELHDIRLKAPGTREQRQFDQDWWNLGQLIYELVQKTHFYQAKSDHQINQFMMDKQTKYCIKPSPYKWQKQELLMNLMQNLLTKNPDQRIGHKTDYHEILHHKYFSEWLKSHGKSQILKRKCPYIIKKSQTSQKKQQSSIKLQNDDWSEMDSYLVNYQFSRDIQ